MKYKRSLAWLLAVVLSVGVLCTAALAADTDAQSQATPKTDSAEAEKSRIKPETDSAKSDETQATRRGRKGGKKEEAAEPDGAIGKDKAKELALVDAGLSADQVGKVRARVSDSDGTTVYKVCFTCDGQRYSYRIDAMSGEILDRKTAADDGERRRPHEKKTDETTEAQGQTT